MRKLNPEIKSHFLNNRVFPFPTSHIALLLVLFPSHFIIVGDAKIIFSS